MGEAQMRVIMTALLVSAFTAPAFAGGISFGPFYVDDAEPRLVVLAGPIYHNAPIDFRRAIRAFPSLDTMALHSDGGDVTAGLLIAQEVFDRGMDTLIGPDSACHSACAYIFFAGINRKNEGQLGVHQMVSDEGDVYSVQMSISDMLDTLADFEVPASVVSDMLRTAPDDMRVYTASEAEALGLNRGEVALIDPELEPPTESAVAISEREPRNLPPQVPSRPIPVPPQALLLLANGAHGATPEAGTVWWSQGHEADGTLFVIAEVSVPGPINTMDAKVRWKESRDDSLPAEVLIEADFVYSGPGAPDRVRSLPGILTKSDPMEMGTALVGAGAHVNGGSFIFALTDVEPAATENIIRLSEPYIDLALTLESGRNAILTLALDDAAQAMFRETLEAWAD
jgi:hypothetical protein